MASRRRLTTQRSRFQENSYAEWIRTNVNLRLSGIIRLVGRSVSVSFARRRWLPLKACLSPLPILPPPYPPKIMRNNRRTTRRGRVNGFWTGSIETGENRPFFRRRIRVLLLDFSFFFNSMINPSRSNSCTFACIDHDDIYLREIVWFFFNCRFANRFLSFLRITCYKAWNNIWNLCFWRVWQSWR